jgi:hypothetical protein
MSRSKHDGAGRYMDKGMDDWTDGNLEDEAEDEEEIGRGIYSYDSYFKNIFNILPAKR